MKKFYLTVLFSYFSSLIFAQTPTVDFNLPANVCLEEQVLLENTSINTTSYEWSLCEVDFTANPEYNNSLVSLGSGTTSLKILRANEEYFGFATGSDGSLLRLEFGNNIYNRPETINLGNLGVLNNPQGIDIVKEGDKWVGFIGHSRTSGGYITRVIWEDIKSVPIAESIGNIGVGGRNREVKIIKQNDEFVPIFLHNDGNQLIRIDFNGSLLNDISSAVIQNTGTLINVSAPIGMDVVDVDNEWGVVISSAFTKNISVFTFGADIFSTPSLVKEQSFSALGTLLKIDLFQQLGSYFAYLTIQNQRARIIQLHDLESDTPIEILMTAELLPNNIYGSEVIKDKNNYYLFGSLNTLFKTSFIAECPASISFSQDLEPIISYSAPGTYPITLTAYDEEGNSSSITKEITVTDNIAPSIDFVQGAQCISNPIAFTSSSDQTLTTHSWDFGDGSTASGAEATHQYTSPGTYKVRLTVESENGCGNFIEKEVNIYETPAPDFSFPAESICTNGAVVFENTTPGEYKEEDITWLWDFGDGITSAEKTPTHTYTTGGTKTVKLTAAIPGCSETQEYQINVVEGPAVNFVADHLCFEDVVQFTNLSSGEDISSFAWDFGNGETSTAENPSMTFTAAGEYEVSLTVNNALGCSNTFTQTVKINALPAVSFENALACSGAPTQFQDKSTVADGSVGSWKWDFGDGTTATERNPTHTFTEAGTYDVKLIITSVAGCIDSVTQTVEVALAPIADFEVALGCPGALTQFTNTSEDLAGDGIEVTYWIINGVYHYTPNPAVLFTKAGTYSVTLAVTSGASCKSTITRNIVVDPLPTPDFTFDNACVGAATIFADQSIAFGDDEVVSWDWEFGNFATATEQHPEVAFPGEGNYGVSLRVTTERGCSAIINKTVTINSLPQAAFAPENNFGAPPLEVKFRNNSTGAVSYQWHFGDAANTSSNETEPVFVYTEVGDYDVRLIAINAGGCADTAYVTVSVLISEVDVALEKINTFTNTGNMQTVLTIRNNGTVPVESMNINLDLSGKLSLNERFTGFIGPGESQNYPLGFDILAEDLPTISYICATLAVTGLNKEELDVSNNSLCYDLKGAFLLTEPYPNPVDQILHLEFFMPDESPVRMVLSDILGNSVMDFEVANTKKGLNEFNYDFSHLAAGMYVLKISHKEESVIKRLVVQ